MRPLNNSVIPGFAAKQSQIGSPEYAERVAKPIMSAVDAMPAEFRGLVNEFGYIEVYRAWKAGDTPAMIRKRGVQ